MKFPTLYIKDKDRLRIWKASIATVQDELGNSIVRTRVQFGLYDGRIQTKDSWTEQGKNLGKSNESTPLQQAVSDIESEMRSMQDKGYRSLNALNIEIKDGEFYFKDGEHIAKSLVIQTILDKLPSEKVDAKGNIKPMILHHARLPEYNKGSTEYQKSKTFTFPLYVQPKKDGICALCSTETGLSTRQGKDRLTPGGESWNDICPHIVSAVQALGSKFILHGEVYHSDLSLQEIGKACKKRNNNSDRMIFCIFDVVAPNLKQSERLDILDALRELILELNLFQTLAIIPTTIVHNYEQLLEIEDNYLNLGEEGIVLRNPEGMYQPGVRSAGVLKLVRFDSSEVLIHDIIPMENEPTHGMFVCRKVIETDESAVIDINFSEFKITPSEFNHQQRIELLMNKHEYIGKLLTINHRGYTDEGIPRIATAKSIRLD